VPDRGFGVSTHLFHDRRLTREDVVDLAAHGFELNGAPPLLHFARRVDVVVWSPTLLD